MSNPQIMTVKIAGQTFYSGPLGEEAREQVRQKANKELRLPVNIIELSPAPARAVFLGLAHAWDVCAEIEHKRKFREAPDSLARTLIKLGFDLAREQATALKKAASETTV